MFKPSKLSPLLIFVFEVETTGSDLRSPDW